MGFLETIRQEGWQEMLLRSMLCKFGSVTEEPKERITHSDATVLQRGSE